MRMAEHLEVAKRKDASSQVAARYTGPGHKFRFDKTDILAGGDSSEPLKPRFSGPQSRNKRNDLPTPYLAAGKVVSHAKNVRMTTVPSDKVGELNRPRAHTDDKIQP
ncbi:unnamed protein product [Schistocephalus solidus]|uniref:Microtubule-associated protein Jupiter n=1 Tax=Schistocephalus solidus TaxID=70667 RepID=A0A183S8K8_SCHSO|nr:unnamed protein product [Schistocephalus solidus]